eukprot:2746090-Prymnesium_polylepis.1
MGGAGERAAVATPEMPGRQRVAWGARGKAAAGSTPCVECGGWVGVSTRRWRWREIAATPTLGFTAGKPGAARVQLCTAMRIARGVEHD